MTNLDAIANLLRIEQITGTLCPDCEKRMQWARKKPDGQLIEVICCASCFTQYAAVNITLNSSTANENCNVAILMDLSIDPSIIMQLDKISKQEEAKAQVKLAEVFHDFPRGEIVTTIMQTLRGAAVSLDKPMVFYTELLRTGVVLMAALVAAKREALPTIVTKQ